MKNEIYNVDYFIRKFEAIPEEKWGTGDFYADGRYCANGFCGVYVNMDEGRLYKTPEAVALAKILQPLKLTSQISFYSEDPIYSVTALINDHHIEEYQQPTPKQRILAALYDIKAKEKPIEPKPAKEIQIIYIDKSISVQAKELVTEN